MTTPIYDQMVEERFTAELADLTATFPDPEDMPSTAPEPPRQVSVIVTATVALLVVAGLLGWLLS